MEFHPIETLKIVPTRVLDGMKDLREIIIGPAPRELTNEELSFEEQTSFYRSRSGRDVSSMSGSLNRQHRANHKN